MKTLFWTTRSKKDLDKITLFYKRLYGLNKTVQILKEIKSHAKVLESPNFDFKKSGAVDTQFEHLAWEYRKLVHRHCKITYREGKDYIYVVRVFDMRQDPIKNL